jgi:hypothetical protein
MKHLERPSRRLVCHGTAYRLAPGHYNNSVIASHAMNLLPHRERKDVLKAVGHLCAKHSPGRRGNSALPLLKQHDTIGEPRQCGCEFSY